jgi:hypothetical protein
MENTLKVSLHIKARLIVIKLIMDERNSILFN